MAERRLSAEEAALWARVKAEVRPLRAGAPAQPPLPQAASQPSAAARQHSVSPPPLQPQNRVAMPPAATLDASWDRRIGRGQVTPDSMLDLHGHSLASAHARLDAGLDAAIARGDRVLLLVTGKPPRAESLRPHARGAIRAAIHDWLSVSRHAARIAAVRQAHPRHGGAGALYIVLRRPRSRGASALTR